MNKYAVYYSDPWGKEGMIHIFAESYEAAEEEVKRTGVGFDGKEAIFAKEILDVVFCKYSTW